VIIEKTFGQKVDIAIRQTLPFLSALLVVLFTVTQTHLPLVNLVMPSFTLSIVYFWTIHRPDLFGVGCAFVIGLLQDLLTGVPLGLFTMTLLLIRAGVATQGLFFRDKPFAVHWWGYALVSALSSLFMWIVAAMIQGVFAPMGQVFMAFVLSVVVFPVIFALCNVIERRILMDVL